MTCERERMRLCLCWVTSITSPNHCYIKSCRLHKVKYNHKWCKRHGLVVTHWALVLIWNHRFESGTSFTPSFPDCPLFPQIKEAIKQKKKIIVKEETWTSACSFTDSQTSIASYYKKQQRCLHWYIKSIIYSRNVPFGQTVILERGMAPALHI